MTRFADLTRSLTSTTADTPPGVKQREVDDLFRRVAAETSLRVWSPGDPISPTGDRLLIGVATWSAGDMALLDAVAGARGQGCGGLVVEVFNVADGPSVSALERYVPGVGAVFHTPVVGLWREGRLVEVGSGKAGRELVERECAPSAAPTP